MSRPSLFQRVNEKIERHSDLVLAIGVVVIIGLLIVRIPPAAMDWFLAVNMSLAFVVLMVALYVKEALRVPSFPTILLLSTLFRLALNVSTTRLILLEADAGRVIQTFGEFVVGGNYVVGAVVFLVLVVVQFVVIAKGSERVAEVAARFTLDAMPGKQMSIDADLRAGLIDASGAKARRGELERESKLYGAMDGAMKFVKGDAIAGIVISLVNIVGGLVIGIAQQGMSLGDAAEVYSLLTIGDGLVSQIPALLVSISAGLIVTRVAAGGEDGAQARDGDLARDLSAQLTANPRGLAIAAGIMLLIGLSGPSTGFPMPPFLGMAAVLGFVAWAGIERRGREAAEVGGSIGASGSLEPHGTTLEGLGARGGEPHSFAPPALVLRIGEGLRDTLAPRDHESATRLAMSLEDARRRRGRDFGLSYPAPRIEVREDEERPHDYELLVRDGVIARGSIDPAVLFTLVESRTLEERGYEVEAFERPGWRVEVARLTRPDQFARARDEGVPLVDAREAVLEHVDRACRQRADLFLGLQEAAGLIDGLRGSAPDLVQAVVPKLFDLQAVTAVLKGLLREQVSIRDLRQVFESLARWGSEEKSGALLLELVRRDLRLALCDRFSDDGRHIDFYSLDRELEALVAEYASGEPLSTEERIEIVEALRGVIDPRRHLRVEPLVLVRDPSIRAALRGLIEARLPEVAVLSQEVTTGFVLRELDRAALGSAELG